MNMLTKNELRQKYRALRDSFGEEFIEKASVSACERLVKSKAFLDADTVLLYYPINKEISPLPLFNICLKMGKNVAFPVCQTKESTLIFKKIASFDSLVPSVFGLCEPKEACNLVNPTEKTLCVVPAISFSSDGHRLGYGKGYYDRFLKNFNGISVGFSYSALVCDSLSHEAHDIPLDMIITESEVLYIDKKN